MDNFENVDFLNYLIDNFGIDLIIASQIVDYYFEKQDLDLFREFLEFHEFEYCTIETILGYIHKNIMV